MLGHWDTTWKYPLLINENGRVIAKDNGGSEGLIPLSGEQTKEEFIKEAEQFWQDLIDEMDQEG